VIGTLNAVIVNGVEPSLNECGKNTLNNNPSSLTEKEEEGMKCPCCEGEGGYTDVVTDEGQGPYYPCDFCNDNCSVNIFMWLEWMWDCVIMEWFRKKL